MERKSLFERTKFFASFASKVIIAHSVTYFVVGAIAYQLLTKPLYIGEDAVMSSFMRTEEEPELWRHVMMWMLPVQIVRGFLIAIALFPFYDTFIAWSWRKRCFVIAGVYLLIGFWACTVAAPGTLEGLVYLRPEFSLGVHLKVQPEIIVQGLSMSAWVAYWMAPNTRASRQQ